MAGNCGHRSNPTQLASAVDIDHLHRALCLRLVACPLLKDLSVAADAGGPVDAGHALLVDKL